MIFDRFKKGLGYVKMMFEKETLNEKRILNKIYKHRNSMALQWMLTGERYYRVDNDILKIHKDKTKEYQADDRLAHGIFHSLIDEKVEYSFSLSPSITSSNEELSQKVIDLLGEDFAYNLESLAYESSQKGIAWVRPYISENGEFKLFIAKSEQIIPGWKDASHRELDYLIRYYDTEIYRFGKEETVTNVEVWFADSVEFYRLESGKLLRLQEDEGHFWADGKPESWGRVPWAAFKNNRYEIPDIKFIKSLIDGYDMTRSEVSNFISEVKNLIFVLKGYSGESLDEFLEQVYKKRTVILDADDDTDVTTLNPTMDIEAAKSHYEQLKRDIFDYGQGVNRDLDKFGTSPSGIALKFLFSGLDLKNNQIESEFRRGFEQLIGFVFAYLKISKNESFKDKINITFARDLPLNEAEIIENCNKSRGLISDDTIRANHPWVSNSKTEKEKLEKEQKESGELFNSINGDDEGDEE